MTELDRNEIGANIKTLLKGYADSKTDIEITTRNGKEADVYLDGVKFNTYLIDEKRFLHNIPKPVKKQEDFSITVVLSRDELKEKYSMYAGAELQLPATENELKDAFQRARIVSAEQKYSIVACTIYGKDILPRFLEQKPDLNSLNYLSKVAAAFSSHEHELFKGLMQSMAEEEFNMKALINGAYNLEHCSIINDLKNDAQLGKIYADNGWIDWLLDADERILKYMDYDALGRDIRETDSGIYTEDGYFVAHKDKHTEVYDGHTYPELFADGSYMFRLQIAKKQQDILQNGTVGKWLILPASKEEKANFLKTIDAESYDECVLVAVQSMESSIPMCVKDLSQMETLNALAHRMWDMDSAGELSKFKAVLSVSDIKNVEDVVQLANELNQYELHPEPSSITEYAKKIFETEYKNIVPVHLIPHFNFASFGNEFRVAGNLKITEYGVLKVPVPDNNEPKAMEV